MKDRKNSRSDRQQGDSGRQNQWQQSQQINRDERQQKSSGKNHRQPSSAHRTQQR